MKTYKIVIPASKVLVGDVIPQGSNAMGRWYTKAWRVEAIVASTSDGDIMLVGRHITTAPYRADSDKIEYRDIRLTDSVTVERPVTVPLKWEKDAVEDRVWFAKVGENDGVYFVEPHWSTIYEGKVDSYRLHYVAGRVGEDTEMGSYRLMADAKAVAQHQNELEAQQ